MKNIINIDVDMSAIYENIDQAMDKVAELRKALEVISDLAYPGEERNDIIKTEAGYREMIAVIEHETDIIFGYDYALEIIKTLLPNIDAYTEEFEIEGEDINLARFFENHPKISDKAEEVIEHWFEIHRNEFITAMLDDMDEEEYEKIKAEVDGKEAAENVEKG